MSWGAIAAAVGTQYLSQATDGQEGVDYSSLAVAGVTAASQSNGGHDSLSSYLNANGGSNGQATQRLYESLNSSNGNDTAAALAAALERDDSDAFNAAVSDWLTSDAGKEWFGQQLKDDYVARSQGQGETSLLSGLGFGGGGGGGLLNGGSGGFLDGLAGLTAGGGAGGQPNLAGLDKLGIGAYLDEGLDLLNKWDIDKYLGIAAGLYFSGGNPAAGAAAGEVADGAGTDIANINLFTPDDEKVYDT
jgi:hypothetical protein